MRSNATLRVDAAGEVCEFPVEPFEASTKEAWPTPAYHDVSALGR
jgi:hypothetical protein